MDDLAPSVYEGIRKTIRRFRERPFHYFTEADIHSSLSRDMMEGASDVFSMRTTDDISISLVHQEYPTNFRYVKEQLLEGYHDREESADIHTKHGDRGNFDVVVLNPSFIEKQFKDKNEGGGQTGKSTGEDVLKRIINKDIEGAIVRNPRANQSETELLFAIEVKFIHLFNSRNSKMLEEVIQDNEKLRLAHYHSTKQIWPINLVFCSSRAMERSDGEESVVARIRNYIDPQGQSDNNGKTSNPPAEVLNVFVQSFLEPDETKRTDKPICRYEGDASLLKEWAKQKLT